MQGLGFLVWLLDVIDNYLTPIQFTQLIKDAGIKWISWKITEGVEPYNQLGGNDEKLIQYMLAVEEGGAVNGGWSYVYPHHIYFPTQPKAQPNLISERVNTFKSRLKTFDHVLLDVEAEWKGLGIKYDDSIDRLLSLDLPANYPIGFCSYRYPTVHPQINYPRFFTNQALTFNAPQVYWVGSHNPDEQLARCYSEYLRISPEKSSGKNFVPIGSTYGAGTWLPTEADFVKFVDKCKSMGWMNYGFYSLDWILKHDRYDWLSAIAGHTVTKPEQPPPQTVKKIKTIFIANIRNAPNLSVESDMGDLIKGAVLDVSGENEQFYEVKAYVAKTVANPV